MSMGPANSETLVTTARLVLRPLDLGDVEVVTAYRRDPIVARFQGWGVEDAGDIERGIREMQTRAPLMVPGPWSQLGVVYGGVLVGDVGVRVLAEEPGAVEIGYTIAPAWQGRGFATEAVRGVCAWALDGPRVRVVATIDGRNGASIAVVERAGFVVIARADGKHAGEPTTFVTYERRR